MAPDNNIFSNLHPNFRGLAWPNHEYVLGTNKVHNNIIANLPAGTWTVRQYDIINKNTVTLTKSARSRFSFDSPNSRAVMFHFKKQ